MATPSKKRFVASNCSEKLIFIAAAAVLLLWRESEKDPTTTNDVLQEKLYFNSEIVGSKQHQVSIKTKEVNLVRFFPVSAAIYLHILLKTKKDDERFDERQREDRVKILTFGRALNYSFERHRQTETRHGTLAVSVVSTTNFAIFHFCSCRRFAKR